MHHLCRPMAIAAGVPMQPGGPNEGCNKGESPWRRGVRLSAGGGEVDRAACVTSEAPGGISNHHNRVRGDVDRQRNQLEDRGRGGHRG